MLYERASNCSFRICLPAFTFAAMPAITRRDNLNRILEQRYGGRIAELSRAIDRDDAYVWQLLNSKRNIGERVARHVENKLGLAPGSLDSVTMSGHQRLAPDEVELLERYRGAKPSWKIALRYLAALHGDVQDEVSSDVNVLLSKISAEHAPDEKVRAAYGKPGTLHESAARPYLKK